MNDPVPPSNDRPRGDRTRVPPRPGTPGWRAEGGTPPRSTLLVFTLGSVTDSRRKRLLPEALRRREAALYDACLGEALAAGRACGFRLEISAPAGSPLSRSAGSPLSPSVPLSPRGERGTPPPDPRAAVSEVGGTSEITCRVQGEGGFGERLAGAFDAAFGATAGPVVVVGTDTPGLTPDRLRRADDLLRDGGGPAGDRAVIGPSPDGGLYLLAADRPLGEILRRVPWRRRGTRAALCRALETAGFTVHLLTPLADLDRPADLEGWLARRTITPRLRAIAAALVRLLAALRLPPVAAAERLRPSPVPVRSGRSPPRG